MGWPYIVSATKVRQYLMCERLPYMDAHRDAREAIEPAEMTVSYDLGVRHEEEVGRWLWQSGDAKQIVSPPPDVDAGEWTLAEMKKGTRLIEQGLIKHENWWGSPDWLRRKKGTSIFGGWYYEPDDAKVGGKKGPLKIHTLPVTFYALLLERVQGVRPKRLTIYRPYGVEIANVDDHVEDTLKVVEGLDRILGKNHDPGPRISSQCSKCRWKAACESDAKRTFHLTLISDMRLELIPRLRALGVRDTKDLAGCQPFEIRRLPYIGGRKAERTIAQANAFVDGVPRLVGRPDIPPHSSMEVFLDIEGEGIDNTTDAFLFGLLVRRGEKLVYWKALAQSAGDRRRAWRALCAKLRTVPSGRPIFHFGHYDRHIIRGFQARYGGARDLENRIVDIYARVRPHVAIPSKGIGLKPIADALGFKWFDNEVNGRMVPTLWSAWVFNGDRTARQKLVRHNQDDLRALVVVTDWARSLQPIPSLTETALES